MPASGANTNKFITTQTIANQALVTLYESLTVKPLIYTDLTQEFTNAGVGDTINVRKPAVFKANKFNRASGIEIQTPSEGSVPVKLDTFLDTSFEVTSEQLALDIADFDAQLLTPAMEAIAEGVDKALLETLIKGATQSVGDKPDFMWNQPECLLMAGALLDKKKVPMVDRAAVIGPMMKAYWNNSIHLKNAEKSGTTEALRRAFLGRDVFGFETYRSANVTPELGGVGAGTEVGAAFHKSALAFGSASLPIPSGAEGAIASHNGLFLRVVRQYDINRKSDIISIDILFGAKVLDPDRIVLLKGGENEEDEAGAESSTITLPSGVTSGTFTLTVGRQTTKAIQYNADAHAVAEALNALSNVTNAKVVGSAGGPYTVTGVKQKITGTGTSLVGGSSTGITVK
ncbi:P22 phage major capsid protein family protein [Corynebacterium diphtheriae]